MFICRMLISLFLLRWAIIIIITNNLEEIFRHFETYMVKVGILGLGILGLGISGLGILGLGILG